MNASEIDDDMLRKAADEALRRPDNFGRLVDLGQYETHGRVASYAYSADDLMAESNFDAMVKILNDAGYQDDFHVTGERDWAFGNMEALYVRVYDAEGKFTQAWREMVSCALALKNYPVLDESDYSERETRAFEAALDSAYGWIIRDADDEDETAAAIRSVVMDTYREDCNDSDSVDEKLLTQTWRDARDDHYTTLGEAFLADVRQAERDMLRDTHTGQIPPLAD